MDFYCDDPSNGRQIFTYSCSHNNLCGIGVVRNNSAEWQYLYPDLSWRDTLPFVFASLAQAKSFIDRYITQAKGEHMSEQYDFGKCPETGGPLTIFVSDRSKQWAIARRNAGSSSNYLYLVNSNQWIASYGTAESVELPTKELAEQRVKQYMEAVLRDAVIPGLIDTSRMRVAFKCPMCGMCHKTEIQCDNWKGVKQVVRRKCPKTAQDQQVGFLIRLWLADEAHPAATVGPIEKLPRYDCKECWGTGEYVGFRAAEPCSTCFPKKV